jgi:terminase large subunit-like protein
MSRSVGLIAACEDPQLFGFDLWPRQRELLAAVESGPRLQIWAAGRRSGKTTLAALVCLHSCLFRPDLDAMVRTGERRYSVAIATNLQQARLLVQAARSIVERSPLLAELIESSTEDEIAFTNGTALRAFPCSSRGGRGWPISTLIMDEGAHFVSESDGYQTAARVWEALVPATAQFADSARVIVSSTPYGTH